MLHFLRPFLAYNIAFEAARGHVRFTELSHNDSLVSPCSHRGLPTEHGFVCRLRVAVSGWYRRVAVYTHTHTRTHTYTRYIYTHTYTTTNQELVWSLFVPRSSRVRCIHTRAYIHKCIYTYMHVHVCRYVYKTIDSHNQSRFVSLFIFLSVSPSFAVSPSSYSFRVPFPRPGLHGQYSQLGRDPSTIESETRYRNLCARVQPARSLAPGETTRKSAADCNQPSLRTSALNSA